jgi:hypothetical protein
LRLASLRYGRWPVRVLLLWRRRAPLLSPMLLWSALGMLLILGRALLVMLGQELATRVLMWLDPRVGLLWLLALRWVALWKLLSGRRVALRRLLVLALRQLLVLVVRRIGLRWVLARIALAWLALLLVAGSRVCKLLHLGLALCEEFVEGARHCERCALGC